VSISLLLVLLLAKAVVLWNRPIVWSPTTAAGYVWQDVAVALVFAAVAGLVRGRRLGWILMAALYAVIVLYSAINVPVALVLSTPLTVPMLRATGPALADSIGAYLTWPHIGVIAALVGLSIWIPRWVRTMDVRRVTGPGLAAALIVVGTGAASSAGLETIGLHRNAVVALAGSALPRIAARADERDWTEPPFDRPPADDLSDLRGLAAGRHVVVVGLESTAAEYLRLYGGPHDLTPRLDELARDAVVFERAYAVTPESVKGLFSVLCSQYPAFDTPPAAYAVPCPSLPQSYASAGYHTALFHSGRFGYLGMNAVVQRRGFGVLEDAGDIGGQRESSFGVDEPATVDRILAWIDRLPTGERFFLTYLPVAGHHPYASPGTGPFSDRDEFGRYLNAVRHGDASVGALIDGLRARGLDQQILWIVYGDHGQAFGQHDGNYGHTFFLYEENVRVPFIVAAPGAIQGTRRSGTTVSLVDIAPTALDLSGLPVPAEYAGHSALDGRPRMALFFTEYSLSLVGLRDGRWKYVHDLTSGQSTLFDLDRDGEEHSDVSATAGPRAAAYAGVLKSWSAAQKARFRTSPERR
jgi:lipoteichoic acid synthase